MSFFFNIFRRSASISVSAEARIRWPSSPFRWFGTSWKITRFIAMTANCLLVSNGTLRPKSVQCYSIRKGATRIFVANPT